jgi:hypothetical protein
LGKLLEKIVRRFTPRLKRAYEARFLNFQSCNNTLGFYRLTPHDEFRRSFDASSAFAPYFPLQRSSVRIALAGAFLSHSDITYPDDPRDVNTMRSTFSVSFFLRRDCARSLPARNFFRFS